VISGDTIAAIATAPGRGGVAIVRVSGPEALSIAGRLTASGQRSEAEGQWTEDKGQRVRKLYFPTTVQPSTFPPFHHSTIPPFHLSTFIDKALVLTFKGPRSYTGEDVVEFHCHGGAVTPRRVLEACFAAGARLARRGEFTERAFLNGKLDYEQAESVLDLIDAKTPRAADAALAGLAGSKRRALQGIYEAALDLSTRLEHALDVDEGELPAEFLDSINSQLSTLNTQLEAIIRRLNEGRLLRDGALVVLAGPPNAGKSSLMNALLEVDRAIVSDMPGTTRDTIEEGLDIDGWPIRLVDTAGLREAEDGVEAEGVRRSEDLMAKADVILWLGDKNNRRATGWIQLHPKCDLGRGEGLNVSAKTGEGLDELKRAIVSKLEARVTAVDSVSDMLDTSPLCEALSLLAPLVSHSPSADPPLTPDIVANVVRSVAEKVGSLVGARYSADLLDNLFSRFCVGK